MRESDIYDELTRMFSGVPSAVAIPVLCEALVHAINCADRVNRAELRDTAIACLSDHVSEDALTTYAQPN